MKKNKPLIYILIMFIIGVLIGVLSYHQFLSVLIEGLKLIKWYIVIIIFMMTLFISILVHEMGHLIVLLKEGIKIRALYVLCFTFVKHEKGWRFAIYPNLLKLVGGLVMPNLPLIEQEETYDKTIKSMSKAIQAGPLFSLGLAGFSIISFILFWAIKNPIMSALSLYFMIFILLITFLIWAASKVSANGLYGDFVATDRLKKNSKFALMYILSGGDTSDYQAENETFLWKKIINELEKSTEVHSIEGQTFISHYLDKIIFDQAIGSYAINEKLKYTYRNLNLQKIEHYTLAQQLLYFYYVYNENEAYIELQNKLDQIKKNPKEEKTYLFWEQRTKYLTNQSKADDYKQRPYDYHKTGWILKPLKLKSIEEEPLIKN